MICGFSGKIPHLRIQAIIKRVLTRNPFARTWGTSTGPRRKHAQSCKLLEIMNALQSRLQPLLKKNAPPRLLPDFWMDKSCDHVRKLQHVVVVSSISGERDTALRASQISPGKPLPNGRTTLEPEILSRAQAERVIHRPNRLGLMRQIA